jgi:hypothetical protein
MVMRLSGVFPDCILDGAAGFCQIIWCHDGTDLDACVKREEPRLGDSRI